MTTTAGDGSLNVTVVDGTELTGLFAADGSMNVYQSDGATLGARYHPCGAIRVTVSNTTDNPSGQYHVPDGSLYVSESPYTDGGQPVTVVTGSFT